jgi:hypothetical protein
MRISKFRTDRRAEEDGVWVDAGEGLQLRIARAGNPRFLEALRRLGAPLLPQVRTGTISEEASEDVLCRAMAEAILLNWGNLQDDDGKDIPYSREKAYQLLLEVRDFRLLVTELSQNVNLYRGEQTQRIVGNSQ